MARIVRNWWMVARVTGRAGDLGFGPNTAKEGEFSMVIYQRDKGDVKEVALISGTVGRNTGKLTLVLATPGDGKSLRVETERD